MVVFKGYTGKCSEIAGSQGKEMFFFLIAGKDIIRKFALLRHLFWMLTSWDAHPYV